MKVLIIEDELPAARQLERLLKAERPDFELIEPLDSVDSAVRWLAQNPQPDLVFMDIQIADGLSFDIFRKIEVRAPVIFTTAFDQYAVEAFRVNAIDYLLKPVDPDELRRALKKIETQSALAPIDVEAITSLLKKPNYRERFLVKTGHHLTFLAIDEIAFFRSSDGLTQAQLFSGKRHFVDLTLEELERQLDPIAFFRISRQMMVAPRALSKIHPHLNGRLKLELQPAASEDVFVARERVADFKTWLGG